MQGRRNRIAPPSPRRARRARLRLAAAGAVVLALGGGAWAAAADDASPAGGDEAAGTAGTGSAGHDHHDDAATGTTASHEGADAEHDAGHDAGRSSHADATAAADDTLTSCVVAGVDLVAAAGDDHTSHHGLVIHDATDGVPTARDCAGAQEFHASVAAAAARFADLDVAVAEGYAPTRRSRTDESPIDHSMLTADEPAVLDPARPEGLVYRVDERGATLLGVVFVETGEADLAQPGGPFTTWHDHTSGGCPDEVPDCGELGGTPPRMLHVWLFPGVADPFAHDYPQAVGDAGLRAR